MKKYLLATAVMVPFCAGTVLAEAEWAGTCDIQFDVGATMHSFEGIVASEPMTVSVDDHGAASWDVTVVVTNMSTFNQKRDREMAEMFHAHEFPHITGTAAGVRLEELQEGSPLPLVLTIRDRSLEQTGTVANVERDGDSLAFDVSWTVSLKAYGLKPPRILFVVVHDDVKITAHFAWTVGPTETSGS